MGYNSIRIVIKRHYRQSFMYCLTDIILALLAYVPISAFMSADQQVAFDHNYIIPLMKLFANAMLMVGAPVTFFSLIKNLTDIYIVSEKNSSGRRLQIKTIITLRIQPQTAFGKASDSRGSKSGRQLLSYHADLYAVYFHTWS